VLVVSFLTDDSKLTVSHVRPQEFLEAKGAAGSASPDPAVRKCRGTGKRFAPAPYYIGITPIITFDKPMKIIYGVGMN
jgi:hypothetical protein